MPLAATGVFPTLPRFSSSAFQTFNWSLLLPHFSSSVFTNMRGRGYSQRLTTVPIKRKRKLSERGSPVSGETGTELGSNSAYILSGSGFFLVIFGWGKTVVKQLRLVEILRFTSRHVGSLYCQETWLASPYELWTDYSQYSLRASIGIPGGESERILLCLPRKELTSTPGIWPSSAANSRLRAK